ncbi:hypothetical protein A6E15_19265 [Natrinema saccharevitans]|uniref:Uncharacterized protein n=1 Tax=Natrinema saccharevitans TaxID=301967 RepID=A0A1S8AQV2_9EURY|nr:hypothetical protein [Natrinema saccharevitans]OLZ39105.1 hypothetical protein A6E15_19265 [Natrinema saccharevitans]
MDFDHTDRQEDRDLTDATQYPIAVVADGDEYVATQDCTTLEARGFSPAEAIANFAMAVDATEGKQVIADE